ncbi:hypothetical protein [Sinorhizobium meliloti]|uniref:hypothetical protein n=1 Tax=Rhizobium meliloti TaxID=382 RepID=UPI000FDCD73C|nr:hypothetical protein [Sinorhizobium meliloti]MDW9550043.1 hypothetical protein [Sinorhizobium meliloti]RVE76946.1 hypothetical protein CN240_32660 [Sinorhizobium meliloti]RVG39948.1 hypothetical protein CN227_32590 [Sinorhizobium meliloti]
MNEPNNLPDKGIAPSGLFDMPPRINWIPTAGKRPLPAMRFYGGTDALNEKTFRMPDCELAD